MAHYSTYFSFSTYLLLISFLVKMDDQQRNDEQQRRRVGWHRTLQIPRLERPHPQRGGTRGYPVVMRRSEMVSFQQGFPTVASRRSIYRWRDRLHPFVMTGMSERQVITGIDQYHMSLFLLAWPEARLDEIIAFIANAGDGTVFSRSQVSERMKHLGLTKKVGSTEARQASRPINVLKRQLFWNERPPFGVNGAHRRRLIDIDECGIEIQSTNRKYGHMPNGIRVVKPGHYSKDTKLTILLGIEAGDPDLPPEVLGSIQNPRKWLRILEKAGTTTNDFNDFVEYICDDLIEYHPNQQNTNRIFMWDNLSCHCSPLIHQTVEGHFGHLIIRRPPYMPADAPIEYVFCQMIVGLQTRTFFINDLPELINTIQNVVTNLHGFNELFNKLGY